MSDIVTPSYVFDTDIFRNRIRDISRALPGIPLTYSVKANPFLVPYIPDEIRHLEVCSPGELSLCMKLGVAPDRIIYSGVMKEAWDIKEALSYGVDMITAESLSHYELIKEAADLTSRKAELLLRLSSGNQFGMSYNDLNRVLSDVSEQKTVHVKGLHYYSGTAKGLAQVEKDIARIDEVLKRLKDDLGFECDLIEYGPGLNSECFASTEEECEDKDRELLMSVAPLLFDLDKRYSLGIEMGRFMATSCGIYETSIMDIKDTDGVSYIITDGGVHQVKYYGQNMAMRVPVIDHDGEGDEKAYTVCGSLCTVADVLVRSVNLRGAKTGDRLSFRRTGAYSVTEAPVLFLSRTMPAVYIRSAQDDIRMIRSGQEAYLVNLPDEVQN